jgi:tetratricopeptide (TPR) repeat protein
MYIRRPDCYHRFELAMSSPIFKQTLDAALKHHQSGRWNEAEVCYRRALAIESDHPEALHLFGLLAYQLGRAEAAEPLIRRAIVRQPKIAEYHNSLSAVLQKLGQHPAAESAARTAISLSPKLPEAHRNLANALAEQNRHQEAVVAYRQSLSIAPQNADAYYGLANAQRKLKQWDAGVDSYRQAVRLRPRFAEAINNLGATLRLKGDLIAALAANRDAIAIQPANARAHSNLATTLSDFDEWESAIAEHRRAIALQPDDPHFHWNLSLALLTVGDFQSGWAEFEYRWGCRDFPSPVRGFAQPLWKGEPLNGRRILLYAEQGFGDTIQFARYVPLVAGLGGKVILEVHPELCRLLTGTPGAERVIARGQPLPPFDVQCPLMSLPLALGTTIETIPLPAPISFDPARAKYWRARLAELKPGRKIGLVWAGQSWHPNDHNRSIPPERLGPLGAIPDACFISLLKGSAQPPPPSSPLAMTDWTSELGDFSDTAALLSELDLVITVDTAVAHLAGSLGKRTFLLLPFTPDFRWLLKRIDSPWYPTVRLFRQPQRGDWDQPLREIAGEFAAK